LAVLGFRLGEGVVPRLRKRGGGWLTPQ
jgi:hypothetical protein